MKKDEKLMRCLKERRVILRGLEREGILRVRNENQAKSGELKIYFKF